MATSNGTLLRAPAPGEKTDRQPTQFLRTAGRTVNFPGFGLAPVGELQTYREMRRNPTIALARAIFTAPIRAAAWSFEGEDPGMVKLVEDNLTPLRRGLVNEMLRAVDYGYQPFETVWQIRGGRVVVERFKPLLPDNTIALVNKHGRFVGCRQAGVELRGANCLWFTFDSEGEDPYGRSMMENIRETAWCSWKDTLERFGKYITLASGVIPIVHFEDGHSLDAAGVEQPNHIIAERLLDMLSVGNAVMIPLQLRKDHASLAEMTIKSDDLNAFKIEWQEKGGSHGGEFVETLRHFERLLFRGWFVPERAGTEGEFGTKADATSHADVAIQNGDQLNQSIVENVNRQVIEPMLVSNFGEAARGAVRAVSKPLDDEFQSMFRQLITSAMADPLDAAGVVANTDWHAMSERAGIPQLEYDGAAGTDPRSAIGPISRGVMRTTDKIKSAEATPTSGADAALKDLANDPEAKVQDAGLNGAQIAALQELLQSISDKVQSSDVVFELIVSAFPSMDHVRVRRMVEDAEKFGANRAINLAFGPHKFASVQANLEGDAAAAVLAAAARIDEAHLAGDGRETEPHATIQYGLHDNAPSWFVVALEADGVPATGVTLGKTRAFDAKDGVVPIYAEVVDGSGLQAIRSVVRGAAGGGVTDTHPTYTPHVTLAYVAEEQADQYVGKDWLEGVTFDVGSVVFASREGERTEIRLGGGA